MRVVVATQLPEARQQLRQTALWMGLECDATDCVAFADLPVRLSQGGVSLVLAAADPDPEALLQALAEAAGHSAAPVVAVGPAGNSQQVLRILRGGAREYVDQARLRDEFPEALERLRHAGAVEYRQGRTVAVIAAHPGSGVTTLAANVAFAVASRHSQPVALAELGTGVPELALDLDLKPPHGVADLLRDWERLDAGMMRQSLVEHAAGVQVLAHPPGTLEPAAITPPAMRQAVLLLRTLFDYTVLDLGHSLTAAALEALRLADSVVVVVRLDVPGLRLSRRFLRQLAERGVPEAKVKVVGNRYGQRHQLAWKKVEEALGTKVLVWVPDDAGALNAALNDGKPLTEAAPRAAVTRRIYELAGHVNGHVPVPEPAAGRAG
jgi:pilus assembly protein CpaE